MLRCSGGRSLLVLRRGPALGIEHFGRDLGVDLLQRFFDVGMRPHLGVEARHTPGPSLVLVPALPVSPCAAGVYTPFLPPSWVGLCRGVTALFGVWSKPSASNVWLTWAWPSSLRRWRRRTEALMRWARTHKGGEEGCVCSWTPQTWRRGARGCPPACSTGSRPIRHCWNEPNPHDAMQVRSPNSRKKRFDLVRKKCSSRLGVGRTWMHLHNEVRHSQPSTHVWWSKCPSPKQVHVRPICSCKTDIE
mmetsp:Transcript_9410/g.57455  ORF Transcript_9410/g.57455 Transcript_9410/m.57455 type:complete len:247 (+) Transcript_9410:1249-1989(+)